MKCFLINHKGGLQVVRKLLCTRESYEPERDINETLKVLKVSSPHSHETFGDSQNYIFQTLSTNIAKTNAVGLHIIATN